MSYVSLQRDVGPLRPELHLRWSTTTIWDLSLADLLTLCAGGLHPGPVMESSQGGMLQQQAAKQLAMFEQKGHTAASLH